MFETPYTEPVLIILPLALVIILGLWSIFQKFSESKVNLKRNFKVLKGGKFDG